MPNLDGHRSKEQHENNTLQTETDQQTNDLFLLFSSRLLCLAICQLSFANFVTLFR